jgi:GNAT superfamily N-acetyltransferase
MTSPSTQALTASIVHQQIDEVLEEINPSLQDEKALTLGRITDWSPVLKNDARLNFPLYFGMLLNSAKEDNETHLQLISFNFAYSTWDGRSLFVDRLPIGDNEKLLLQVLAKIAIRLGCSRLLWFRTDIPDWWATCSKNLPETLQEWHILRMSRSAMETYVGKILERTTNANEVFTRSLVESQVNACLSSRFSSNSKFRLRLAGRHNKDDADQIARLVHGLAVYEKRPDAVKRTAQDYLLDGSGDEPLFYCLLVDYYDSETNQTTTCGMAFVYFGYLLEKGRFLYLEDLFFEEAYRKKGGGSLALHILAEVGLRLNCESFFWTALDWNTPALNLYAKIGAKVQPGLKVSFYTDNKLIEFANEFSSNA